MKITTNPYFREQGYIDGLWCNAKNNETVDVIDPATGALLGTVPNMATTEAKIAVEAAHKALPRWRALTAHQRATLLQN
ncbi:aldehyde dehydrogenase family protein, partial [Klebsiella pneumoniae]|uniref:aldehyde dehydrogenase family protein n=1 Tax=Klebsiella pneumoniae TaxID=573 RepID=UPI001F3AEFAF